MSKSEVEIRGKSAPKIKIMVAYHKKALFLQNEILTPIHAGRDVGGDLSKDGYVGEELSWLYENMIGDNTGENISSKNRSYNEATAIYWAWKNQETLGNPDYIGFMHYRRQFIFDEARVEEFKNHWTQGGAYRIPYLSAKDALSLFSEGLIKQELSGVDIINTKPFLSSQTSYENYTAWSAHVIGDLDETLNVINELYPEFSQSASEYMEAKNNHHFWNMFVMKKEIFNEFAKFAFDILFELEKRIDITNRSIQKQRAFGYLCERLTGIFIYHLQKNNPQLVIKEKYVIMQENTDIAPIIKPAFEDGVNVVFSSDDKYAIYLCVGIQSLIENSSAERNYDIFVLDDKISAEHKKRILNTALGKKNVSIRFIDISVFMRDIDKSSFYLVGYFSISTYYRFFIPRIFDAFDKVLYLDCDMVILDDVAKLFDTDLGDKLYAAAPDPSRVKFAIEFPKHYIYLKERLGVEPIDYRQNGVLLMNTAKMREIGFEQMCIEEMKRIGDPLFVYQDVMNALFWKQILRLDLSWNVEWHLLFPTLNAIRYLPQPLHYCSAWKPWKSPELPNATHFWKYARMTPCYEEILKQNEQQINTQLIKEVSNLPKYKRKRWRYKLIYKLTFGKTRKRYKRKYQEIKNKINAVNTALNK